MAPMTDEKRNEIVATLLEAIDGSVIKEDANVLDYDIVHEPEMDERTFYPTGATFTFRNHDAQERFVTLAKKLFATSKGEHRENGEVRADYQSAIMRLPFIMSSKAVETDSASYQMDYKAYPLHLSDAALAVLGQRANGRKIAKEYGTIAEKDAVAEEPEANVVGRERFEARVKTIAEGRVGR